MLNRSFPSQLLPWTLAIIVAISGTFFCSQLAPAGETAAATTEARLTDSVGYLASDELEGRGVGTKGLEIASGYLRDQFKKLGLRTEVIKGSPFQKFTVTTGSRLGKTNSLTLVGPAKKGEEKPTRLELKLGKNFNPLAIGGSGQFQLPVVFVGYGISGRSEKYDDYANVDVKGKAVVILRHEPEQNNPHSVFNGTDHSEYAPYRIKVSNAYQHEAAAVIFCTDEFEINKRIKAAQARWQAGIDELAKANEAWKKIEKPTRKQLDEHRKKMEKLAKGIQDFSKRIAQEYDPLLAFRRAGQDAEGRDIPVLFCTRAALDPMIKAALGKDLAALEQEIDKDLKPQSAELQGWRVMGQTNVERDQAEIQNVIAVLEGEGPLADETVVIGAHYDHLGYGGPGSADPGKKEIHNGADDNASGTAVLLEVARQLASREKKLPRRLVFMAFTGEERGLLGSAHYVKNPIFPLDKTVAMLNMDMVGRLQENKLIVNGIGTAKEFPGWVDELNKATEFHLIKKPSGFGPSDHSSFYSKKIPVLHFFTGSHKDYHRPTDDTPKLNVEGMRRVGELVAQMAVRVAETKERPTYQETKRAIVRRGGTRPYFGSIPDFRSETKGYALSGVAKDSPAQKAGLKGGDVVIRFGENKIGNLSDIDLALRKYKAGNKVPVVVLREGKEVTVQVILDPPR